MSNSSLHILAVVLALACTGGCESIIIDHGHGVIEARAETLAAAYCAAYTACDCSPLGGDAVHPDPDACEAEQQARIVQAFDAAEAADLEFDQACMDQLLARFGDLDCGSWSSVQAQFGNPALAEQFGCALYHGDVDGGVCNDVGGTPWSDCDAGLGCFDHTCQPRIAAGGEGAACTYASEVVSYDCEAGLVCDPNLGCIAGQQLGEPCLIAGDGSSRCGPELFCAPLDSDGIDGTCEALRSDGQACDNDWECHGWCREGACIDIPAVCLQPLLEPPVEPE